MKIIIPLLLGIALFFVIGWLTGNPELGGANKKDDERSRLIKQKAITSSWLLVLLFLVTNFVFDFFNLLHEGITLQYPELFYLILLIGSYFVYYLVYNRKHSANEK